MASQTVIPLLGCCFESADYVELLNTSDPEVPDDLREGTVEENSAAIQEASRPPRDIAKIIGALTVVVVSMAMAALSSQQLWNLLRRHTESWCEGAPDFMGLGLHALHLGKVAHSTYCNQLRSSPGVEGSIAVIPALIFGPLALRLTYGRAYFSTWSEAEELVELERLYKERGYGTRLVLHSWRIRMVALFIFEIVVWMWLRYYMDLYLDVQAMQIFLKSKDYQFFTCNLMGIVLGIFWTAVEFYKLLREGSSSLPGSQVLLVGIALPLGGMHMTYLSVLSLLTGTKHRLLYISALAEAILESAVSAFVQTYAVVFSSSLQMEDKIDLYSSIALSFVSIGFAFSSLDKNDGGELLCFLPGSCRSSNARWWIVFLFRVSEVASRATSLALFQRVWRPYGLFAAVGIDALAILLVAILYQYARGRDSGRNPTELLRNNLIYALPSTICLMTPMLEKDTPLTVPPGFYYTLRVLELAIMASLMGRKVSWDMHILHDTYFADDALVVATFAVSTVLMILSGLYLRNFRAVRVLLEAPMEVWCQRPFDITQQVLRNRILLAGGRSGRLSMLSGTEQKRLLAKVDVHSNRTSSEVRARLREELADCARGSNEEWEALYLDAKVSLCVERSLTSLENSFSEHSGVIASSSMNMSKQFLVPTKMQLSQSSAAIGQAQCCELKMGDLITLIGSDMGRGSCLTSVENQVLMQYPHEAADQKFVIEPAFEIKFGEKLLSGSIVRLRALSNGDFLSVAEDGSLQVRALPRKDESAGLDFKIMLSREEEFRNSISFGRRVQLAEDGLTVTDLRLAGAGPSAASDRSSSGWKIAAINGEDATRELVAEVLRQDQEGDDEPRASGSKSPSDLISSFPPSQANSGISIPGSSKLKVRFEKVYGHDMAITFGDKIILRTAGSNDAGAPISFLFAPSKSVGALAVEAITDRATPVLATDQPLVALKGGAPIVFSVEKKEVGSTDDTGIYRWTADEVHKRKADKILRTSLPEKLKSAVVMAYNARTDLKGVGVLFQNRALHLRLLRLLAWMLREHKETEVEFESRDAFMEELRLIGGGTRPIVVEAIDADDGLAAAAGIQVGDEIIELEIDRDGSANQLLRSTREIGDALRLISDGRNATRACTADRHSLVLLFRSHTQTPVDTKVQEVVVSEAPTIAQLLPGWDEIAEEKGSTRTPRQFHLPEKVEPFRHNELFRLKCLVVTSLLEQGWELNHAAFADVALVIHEHFDVLTRRQLQDLFPGHDHARRQLRDRILIAQLDVLTAAWQMCPKTVKEHHPDVLRKLFRWDRELQAMLDAVEMIHKIWLDDAQEDSEIVGMPAELLHFLERVRPHHEIGHQGSVAWIMKAWYGQEFKEEHAEVSAILGKFKSIHDSTEEYWVSKLSGAASRMEQTQDQLERALDSSDVRVILVPKEQAIAELTKIQQALKPSSLILKVTLNVGDSDVVPKGHRLLRRGHVDRFPEDTSNKEVHARLPELASCEVDSLRLMFSGDDYHSSRERASKAIEELRVIINVVRGVARAFPDTVALQYRELEAKQHRGELKNVTQENRRVIQVREKEFAAMMSTANLRLDHAMSERAKAQERLREAEQERAMAEEAKNESLRKYREVLEIYQKVLGARDQLEKDKMTVEEENAALQSEKAQWIKARADMDDQLRDLQESITKAKKERRELELAAEKWQAILVSVRAQAEEKERHLKEIQEILEGARGEHSGILVEGAIEAPTTTMVSSSAAEADGDLFQQVWAVLSRAFTPEPQPQTARSLDSGAKSPDPRVLQRALSSLSRPALSRNATKNFESA